MSLGIKEVFAHKMLQKARRTKAVKIHLYQNCKMIN